jgi:hypothetical protein
MDGLPLSLSISLLLLVVVAAVVAAPAGDYKLSAERASP